jgi:hypothetical protein
LCGGGRNYRRIMMVKKIRKRPVRRLKLPRSRQSQSGTKVPRTVIAHGSDTRWKSGVTYPIGYRDEEVSNPLLGLLVSEEPKMVDGDTETPVAGTDVAGRINYEDQYGMQFEEATFIGDVRLYAYTDLGGPIADLTNDTFWLYESDDNETWEQVDTVSNPPYVETSEGYFYMTFTFNTTAKYIKIYKQIGYLWAGAFCWPTEMALAPAATTSTSTTSTTTTT